MAVTDPEFPVVPDPVVPAVAGVLLLTWDDDVFWVPVGVAVTEWPGVADLVGDDRVTLVLGLPDPLGVVLAADPWLGEHPPDGIAVTECSAEVLRVGLAFVEVLVGSGVGVALPLSVGLGEGLELSLALGLLLTLAVLVGLVVLWGGLLDWLTVLLFVAAFDADGGADGDDEHDESAPGELPPGDSPLGSALPFPSPVPPPLLVCVGATLCEPRPVVWRSWWRSGGTAASTTPMANTARPTDSAGRSIASRQSPNRRGAGAVWEGSEPSLRRSRGAVSLLRSSCQRRSRPATKAAIAALRDWMAVAWAGRERIFSRIRSRPSAPGST